MKRFLIMSLIAAVNMMAVFADGTKWKVVKTDDIYGTRDGINFSSNGVSFSAGNVVDALDPSVVEDPSTKREFVKISRIIEGYFDINFLEPADCNVHFKEYILKPNLRKNNKFIISESYFKALSKKDRNALKWIEPNGYAEYEVNKTDMDYEWYVSSASYLNNSAIYNVTIYLSNIFGYYSFFIRNIKQNGDEYLITVEVFDVKELEKRSFTVPQKGNVIDLKMKLDGDYINFYYQNDLFGKYVIVDSKTSNEIKNLLLNNSCNYSNITWPRHADGSCDYD